MKNIFDLSGKVIALTGGTGLLGSNTNSLLNAGATVIIADLKKPSRKAEFLNKEYR